MFKVKRKKTRFTVGKLPMPSNAIRNLLSTGFTQKELGKSLGLSQPLISQILHQKRQFLLSEKMLVSLPATSETKKQWIAKGFSTLIKSSPRDAAKLLPASFIEQHAVAINDCLTNEFMNKLLPINESPDSITGAQL